MRKPQNIITRSVSFEVARLCLSQPAASVLKLRVWGLRKIKGAKTQGIIITRRVSEGLRFWVLREMKCADRNSCLDR